VVDEKAGMEKLYPQNLNPNLYRKVDDSPAGLAVFFVQNQTQCPKEKIMNQLIETNAMTNPAENSLRPKTLILLIRSIHGLITLYFLSCIGLIYYADISRQASILAYLAAASLVIEGIVVTLNHGDCPLDAVHHRVGDDKTFFELFLPKPLAKSAVPVLGVVAIIGIGLLLI